MSKKNIDKLFQEKFKDFRERPDDKVWSRIEATLNERKKSRNIIPFWWKLGAIAAGLSLLIYFWSPFENKTIQLPTITNSEKGETPAVEQEQVESTAPAITDMDNKDNSIKEEKESNSIDIPNHGNDNINTAITSVKSHEMGGPKNKKKEKEQPYKAVPSPIITPSGKETQWTAKKQADTERSGNQSNTLSLSKKSSDTTDQLAQNALENRLVPEHKEIRPEKSRTTPLIPQNETSTAEAMTAVDSTGTNKKKSIFEVTEDNDLPEEVALGKKERWSVAPSIAPVYFNTAGEGSSIAPSFVSNSKSGEVSLSYGVLVSYGFGKKWSIRSGIQRVNYGYSTNDISYTSTFGIVSIANIDNIKYNMSSENLFVQNQNEGKPIPGMALDAAGKSPTRTGKMLQQFGYLEVPMEVNYALMDKKFGIDLIGGVSSLFLTDNSVTLESGDRNTELGEANNINSVNFSANIGFGLNYRLMPKVHLNVEPIFKYQLNTFSNTAGSFQPFSIGVYSGLNFKF